MRIVDGKLRLEATDLANFLACRHLTRFDQLAAEGRAKPDRPFDVGLDLLAKRGDDHEGRVLEEYRARGLGIVEVPKGETEQAVAATRDAVEQSAAVVYQGVLQSPPPAVPPLLGRPDFIVLADEMAVEDGAAKGAGPGHEVVDAKLARSAKARAVLQTAFYSKLLGDLQGREPRNMHLALGDGELTSFRVGDVAAYERRIRSMLEAVVAEPCTDSPPSEPYPEPVEHCAICRWSTNCNTRRRSDDDLSLVAGMPTRQRLALKEQGISTRRGFAALELLPKLGRGDPASLERAQLQARLQVESEDAGEIRYQLLEPERGEDGALTRNRGLLALPEPNPGDLFFDIEGARHYSEDGREFGLQYLFGVVDTADVDEHGKPRYTAIWAFDRQDEKRAFEELVDFITTRREKNPGLHVYHYNHYEPTSVEQLTALHATREEAVGRLMGRFATREDEVDDLFRLGVFVDLYRVVRQGLRAGVESYSIKRLEPLAGFERQVRLDDATEHLISFEMSLDEGNAADDVEAQTVVAGYNEDDCRSTLALRAWLEARRDELEQNAGESLPRPILEEEAHSTEDPEVVKLKADLVKGLPEDPESRTEADNAKALLADLLEWHRREAKPAWWQFFRLKTLSSAELVDERDALGELSGGDVVDHIKRSVVRRFSFPAQEHGFSKGEGVYDPATGKRWTIHDLDDQSGTVDLRIGINSDQPLPDCIIVGTPVNTDVLAARLGELGRRVATGGLSGDDPATALLLRLRPASEGDDGAGPLRHRDEVPVDAAVRLIMGLRDSYLAIQGPPGSGKTYTGARAIRALVGAGRTVAVTGPSHAVIHNLLEEVAEQAGEAAGDLRIGQRADADNPFLHSGAQSMKYDALEHGLRAHELDIGAGSVWTWAREEFAGSVDTLFVDEAGQMSLADLLAVSQAARNIVLLGDPQQLAQPSRAAHPPGAEESGLEYVLRGRATMPDDAGLFLDETYRMHPALCQFTSDLFYDGRLTGVDGLEQQTLLGGDPRIPKAGLTVVEVEHEGNTNCSPEEASVVAELVDSLRAYEWMDHKGKKHDLAAKDILVVTPYNAQIRAIEQALRDADLSGFKVGTVDRFQGREAPVVIYSMATSSAADAPRGMEFLFDLHRLNVATSRARAVAIIVGSPDLVRVYCTTPRQMVLANALCVAWESVAE